MSGVTHSDIDFTIENFSCWNYEAIGNKILLPKKELTDIYDDEEVFLKFYPRGATGRGKHLVVRFCNEWFSGDLEISFISSDGSPIKTESMNVKDYRTKSCTGPEYERVIAAIRENEPFHKDSLTIRLRKKCDRFSRCQVQFAIGVLNASVKINSKIFKDSKMKKDTWNYISSIHYPVDTNTNERLELHAFKIDSQSKTNVKFKILPDVYRWTKTLTIVSIFYQLGKGAIVKHQDVECVLSERCEAIHFKSLPIVEDEKRNFYIILRSKTVMENTIKSHNCTSSYPCEIKMDSTNSSKTLSTAASLSPRASLDVLRKEMTRLYRDCDFSDFQLRCGQLSFAVHKGILSARSPVFKTMLSREADSVDVEDLDAPTLDLFLAFLYSGKVDDSVQWEDAVELYYAADKYAVPTLKRECVSILCDEVSVGNVREVLSLAYNHDDEKLTLVGIDFLLENNDEVWRNKEWRDYVDVDPEFFVRTTELMKDRRMSRLS